MFLPTYNLFGAELTTRVSVVGSSFKVEQDSYAYFKKIASAKGWRCLRVETSGQDGFPDILLIRKQEYWLMEVKRLKKAKLRVIEDDLEWQFGQLAFAKRSLTKENNYLLAVVKGNNVAYIKGVYDVQSTVSYPDFVR